HQESHAEIAADLLEQAGSKAAVDRIPDGNASEPGSRRRIELQQIDVQRLLEHLAEHEEHARADEYVAGSKGHSPAAKDEDRHRPQEVEDCRRTGRNDSGSRDHRRHPPRRKRMIAEKSLAPWPWPTHSP